MIIQYHAKEQISKLLALKRKTFFLHEVMKILQEHIL